MLTSVNVIMHPSMKIVIDQNIPGVNETFAHHGEVFKTDGRQLSPVHLAGARALIVRSVTAVNRELLHGTAVEFVGTTTIGTDHLDIPWLEQHGIRWASAPGCNADAAAQYTLGMITLAGRRLGFEITNRSLGIIGHGNVGSRVHRLLTGLGVRLIKVYDPPLADAGHPELCQLEELADCDVISFHVPLIDTGPYPTMGLVSEAYLSALRPGTLLVNTSRGKVTRGPSLRRWLTSGLGHAALDVWPDEPDIDIALLEATTVATPHVAGYSLDGKLRGTQMVYREFCNWLKVTPNDQDLLSGLVVDSSLSSPVRAVDDAILTACPVERDDAALRKLAGISAESRPAYFDALRHNYPERRDFAGWQVPPDTSKEHTQTLQTLGFH